MKKLIAVALLTVSIFGSLAMANDQLTLKDISQGVVIEPLNGCTPPINPPTPTPQPTSVEPQRYCNPDQGSCPIGYEPVAKYCWGGWGQGWYRCGWACRFDHSTGGH